MALVVQAAAFQVAGTQARPLERKADNERTDAFEAITGGRCIQGSVGPDTGDRRITIGSL